MLHHFEQFGGQILDLLDRVERADRLDEFTQQTLNFLQPALAV